MKRDAPSRPGISRAAVSGTASGVFFMAFFGALWAGIGIGGLQARSYPWLAAVDILIGVALLAGGICLLAASRRLKAPVTEADARRGKRIGIWFGIVFTTEGVLIGAASAICNSIGRFDLFFPVMAIIVGAHFLPLAPLFQFKTHYVTGTLLCLLAIVTLLAVPEKGSWGGDEIVLWWVVVGFGSAVILWATGLSLVIYGKKLLDKGLK